MTHNDKTLSPQELEEERVIQAAFDHLLETYMASNHRKKKDIITRAFHFSKQAHKGVRRRSGEPYILHPIAVAQIACEEIGLGSTSICAALLHDVEEDTDYTNEDIANLFGQKVANIVEGLTKISGGFMGDRASLQAETFKKLLLTMSEDIRVILIKISDRLHNMRTLASMPASKQYKIAGETLYIFAPIADRLGLYKIKTELEDLSFKYEHPEDYKKIATLIEQTQGDREEIFEHFVPPIKAMLDRMGYKYHILKRVKSPYSIWHKIKEKHVSFKEVYDILAIRIIYQPKKQDEEIDECFSIYAGLTQIYQPHPKRFRDWLSTPKNNGYQALHNTFMSKDGKWIEVQIRSEKMDEIAEKGFAAHWKYKDKDAPTDETDLNKWLNSVREILDDPQPDTLDLLDTIKLNLFSKEILVFTPKGEIKKMPNNSSVIDFAFSIHTVVGTHCFGVKVNHKLVPLNYKLSSGDQVEILTSREQQVKPEWLDYAVTAKAQGKIKAVLRKEWRKKISEGKKLLKTFFEKHHVDYDEGRLDKLRLLRGFASKDELAVAVAERRYLLSNEDANVLLNRTQKKGWRKFVPFMGKKEAVVEEPTAVDEDFVKHINKKKTFVITDKVLPKCLIPTCCNPISGDEVLGYITPQHALEIHKRSCQKADEVKASYGNNIVAAKWDTHRMQKFRAYIHIKGMDGDNVLLDMAYCLKERKDTEVKAVHIETNNGIFEGNIEFLVYDNEDVKDICNRLKKLSYVQKAYREEG